jgi:type IV fimbrial biogenesis protein FimT
MLGQMKTAQVLAAAPRLQRGRLSSGFTLVELMVVIALIGVILALAAPSMRDMIDMRRLRAINAQLVTDMQFARSEAVAKRVNIRVIFAQDTNQTCYTIFTAPRNDIRCNCLLGEGNACGVTAGREVKTVSVPRSSSVLVTTPVGAETDFAFEPAMGSIIGIPVDDYSEPLPGFLVDTSLSDAKKLRVLMSQAGRPQVCRPAGSTIAETECP